MAHPVTKWNALFSLVMFFMGVAWIGNGATVLAYPPQIEILEEEEIQKLTDAELRERYIDVVVEQEAMKAFHTTSGFSPKDYKDFKRVIRYKIFLLEQLQKRNMTPPPTN